ncbi:MAG: PQQ-dependent sugar dehydrogenase [Chloroflexi bacterium]|nr:PQQ-dependent sugar dehydrogenase [Chloroflexota bacterium]
MQETPNDLTLDPLVGCTVIGTIVIALITVILVVAYVFAQSTAPAPITEDASVAAAVIPATPVITRATAPNPSAYTWVEVATGYDNPLFVTHANDGSGRLFGVEQTGKIWVIEADGTELPQPFLDITPLLPNDVFRGTYTERGLLGLAFHPNYRQNGLFFVSYTNTEGDSVLARYSVSADDPNRADLGSAVQILHVDQPFVDHNGGHIAFGPDGYLYMGLGDGGRLFDELGHGQNTQTLLSTMLRIDINAETYTIPPDNPFIGNPEYLPEIWAVGVRNPWRFSFDRATGDLYIGDVGQLLWEEINFQPATSPGGENYGWSIYEGRELNQETAPDDEFVMPVFQYEHALGCSVTGGYVYRGDALPELHGVYFFGDYCIGRVWIMYRDPSEAWQIEEFMLTNRQIASFGEDEQGELYLVDYKGDILRLTAADSVRALEN